MLSEIGVAVLTFCITNIDDLLILSLYFANTEFKTSTIVTGQYLGIICIILVSFIGLLLGAVLPEHWISLLGVIPMGLGVKGLIQLRHSDGEEREKQTSSSIGHKYLTVAAVTFANGGDNIGVYAPLFANVKLMPAVIYVVVFLILTSVWCMVAYYISSHIRVKLLFSRYGKVVLPVFLIALGMFIAKDFAVWLLSMLLK